MEGFMSFYSYVMEFYVSRNHEKAFLLMHISFLANRAKHKACNMIDLKVTCWLKIAESFADTSVSMVLGNNWRSKNLALEKGMCSAYKFHQILSWYYIQLIVV